MKMKPGNIKTVFENPCSIGPSCPPLKSTIIVKFFNIRSCNGVYEYAFRFKMSTFDWISIRFLSLERFYPNQKRKVLFPRTLRSLTFLFTVHRVHRRLFWSLPMSVRLQNMTCIYEIIKLNRINLRCQLLRLFGYFSKATPKFWPTGKSANFRA